jgi:primosomal protein N'
MYFMKVLSGTQQTKNTYQYCHKCNTRFNVTNYQLSCRLHRPNKNGKCRDCHTYLTNMNNCYHIITPSLYQRLLNFLKLK